MEMAQPTTRFEWRYFGVALVLSLAASYLAVFFQYKLAMPLELLYGWGFATGFAVVGLWIHRRPKASVDAAHALLDLFLRVTRLLVFMVVLFGVATVGFTGSDIVFMTAVIGYVFYTAGEIWQLYRQ